MAKIAVTGATGFIGTRLVEALLKAGHVVYPIDYQWPYEPKDVDIIYHLACPSTTAYITANPTKVMDIILDKTREALFINQTALFVNASSMGALELANDQQGAYNIAKRCMEVYLANSGRRYMNYRLPAVYGPGMQDDGFIKRCVDHRAYEPPMPDKTYWIAHIDEVIDAMVNLRAVNIEETTLGQIYESFNSGRRGLHRPTSS